VTVRPPKGVRSAGNLAGCVGRSQKERIGVVPIQDRHQDIKCQCVPGRGHALLSLEVQPERGGCLLKGIAEGTYKSKHAEAARLDYTTTTTTTTTHIHTHTPTEL